MYIQPCPVPVHPMDLLLLFLPPPRLGQPLTCYVFTTSPKDQEAFTQGVTTGSMCINDCVVHFSSECDSCCVALVVVMMRTVVKFALSVCLLGAAVAWLYCTT